MAEIKDTKETKEVGGVTLTQDQFNEIMSRLNAAENKLANQPQTTSAPQSASQAQLTPQGVRGIQEKFPTNKALYQDQDPRERLMSEKEFSRFNLKENYELFWNIEITRYQTAQGLWLQEPRFELELRKKAFDDDGNVRGAWQIQKLVVHEDYDAAVDIAIALGIDVDPEMKVEFINEMRYQQFKLWLSDLLFPKKTVKTANTGIKQEVVNGTAVTFYENPKDLNKEL